MKIQSRLHACKAESRIALGYSSAMNSVESAELIVGNTHPDWVMVDMQHSTITTPQAANQLRAIQAADPGTTPIVRLAQIDTQNVEQTLDAGFMGLIAPMVESVEEAQKLARLAYYPPRGARSAAESVRCSLYENYAGAINDHLFVWAQIESQAGLDAVEDIAQVPGITGLMLGPGDLCLSCGWPIKDAWNHEPFMRAVRRFLAACRNFKKESVILVGWPSALKARDAGFQFIGIGADSFWTRTTICDLFKSRMSEMHDATAAGGGPSGPPNQ